MKYCFTLLFFSLSFLFSYAQNIPIDFEASGNGADWTWTTFENDTNPPLEVVANPDVSGLNTSSTVAKFTALQAGQPFAGCESLHGAGIGTFTIDASSSIIRILVWKTVISDVGIKLVREDNWSLGEIKVANTLVNQWEQLEFDFSAHIGNTYDQIVIFPDFAVRQADNVVYFDAVYGEVATPTSLNEPANVEVKLFPNPAHDHLSIQSGEPVEEYRIFSTTGEMLEYGNRIGQGSAIDISSLPQGIYILKATINRKVIMKKFIKS
jgi:hypothetical protein